MQPMSVDLVLLRSTAPDLPLAVGRILAARVVERHGRHGVLNLAGAILTAELPEEVEAGDRLRLVVRETTSDRVVLALAEQPPSPAQVPPPLLEAPLPGGGRVAVLGRDGSGARGEGAGHDVTLRCELPALGPVELWIELEDHVVRARVALREGAPLALAEQHAPTLQHALAGAAGRPAEVSLVARPDPLDVYA
jgi:hypothetical protein